MYAVLCIASNSHDFWSTLTPYTANVYNVPYISRSVTLSS